MIAAARLGDEDASAELYRQHAGYVHGIGRSILRTDELDDLSQDTFLLAFSHLHDFQESCAFRTWISRIAVNQCRAILRKRRQAKNGDAHLVSIDAGTPSDWAPEGGMFGREDPQVEATAARLDLAKLLRVLTSAQRRLLELAYLEDTPAPEIAQMLGIPVGLVRGKIHQAKRRVRNAHKNR